MEKSINKTANPFIMDTFLKGCAGGFKVGIENITPAMILGYTLVYILQATGLMTFFGRIFASITGVLGPSGEAFAALVSTFFAETSGCVAAATIYANEELTSGQASMLLPTCILMGTLIGHYARIVLVAGTSKKWHTMLLIVPLFNAALLLIIMHMILMTMGIA